MSNIRMVVTDLDNTYLRRDKTVSDYTRRVTQALRDRGIPFVIATARPVRAVKQWLPWLKYDMGVFHNGAVICDENAVIARLGVEQPQTVLSHLLAHMPNAHIAAEADEVLYANFDAAAIWTNASYVPTQDFAPLGGITADKLLIEAHTLAENDAIGALLPENLYAQLCEHKISMVMNRRASKVNGIRLLAEKLGISDDEIVAFGDDYNDIGMLTAFGTGVAVDNALPEVKAAADAVCADCDSDGVARWIEENLL